MSGKSIIKKEDLQNYKKQLRLSMRALRQSLSMERRNLATKDLLHFSERLSHFSQVFSFKSFPEEINTEPLNTLLHIQGKLYLPHVQGNTLIFSQNDLPVMKMESTVILVPGIAFDKKHYRLGYGKGHYDRFLATISASIPTIGIGFKEQLVDELPKETHDVRLSEVVLF